MQCGSLKHCRRLNGLTDARALSDLQGHSGKGIRQLMCKQCVHAAAHATPAASTSAAEPHRPVASAAEPHVPTQKELLAASLFGDSSSRPARQRRHPAHHAAPAAHHTASAQPAPVATSAAAGAAQPAAADLLLALDSPGPTASAVPAVSSGQHESNCPSAVHSEGLYAAIMGVQQRSCLHMIRCTCNADGLPKASFMYHMSPKSMTCSSKMLMLCCLVCRSFCSP